MKATGNFMILSLVSLLVFGFASDDVPVNGWFKTGSMPDSYKTGTDNNIFRSGQKSAFIESTEQSIDGFATIMQICSSKNYSGTRIKMTGYIRSETVADWAGMWLRLDYLKIRIKPENLDFEE